MSAFTRRQLLKSGLAVSAVSLAENSNLSAMTAAADKVSAVAGSSMRERLLMDHGWKFALGNAADPKKDFNYGRLARERTFAKAGNIQQATLKFDDSAWRAVDLPHDWAVELPFISTSPAPETGARPLGREFPETSVGWYRKTFSLSSADASKRIQILFDGVYRDATILLNGHFIATNFSGYAPLPIDITDWLHFDQPNVLAVRVDASMGDGWFYEGAGIYRHVWLIKSDPVHLVEWGTYVRSTLGAGSAKVDLGSEVRNNAGKPCQVSVSWQLKDPLDKVVASASSEAVTIPDGATATLTGQTAVANPALWSIEQPARYTAIAIVHSQNAEVDSDTTTFGFRDARFDANHGFLLDGRQLKIKGTCCHQDHAGVGVALPDRIQYFRVERLKAMGSNGLRTSHNPPTPELMEATDALGMLVMCETRMMDSSTEGLSQLERMIRRFRNHPSIVIWSLGNEEPEQGTEVGQRVVATMQKLAHKLDPTRVCTVAMNGKQGTGISYVVDVQGFNYGEKGVDGFHQKFPRKPVIGTETASTFATRGIYETDKTTGNIDSYGEAVPGWGASPEKWWSFYAEREFLAGGFAWTGFDYRGEPTPNGWPCVSSHFGIMDTCGFPKDIFFYYKAWWSETPVLHLFPHWSWPDAKKDQPIRVWCHSNLDSIELLLNGKSLGTQTMKRNSHVEWSVPFVPGVLEARGLRDGKVVLTERRETTGPAARVVLRPDRSTIDGNREDVSIITVEVQDSQGRATPTADNLIDFEVTGGALIGLGNGDQSSHESDKGSSRRVFNGLAQAIVQAGPGPGSITVSASSPGLDSATCVLTARAIPLRPAIA